MRASGNDTFLIGLIGEGIQKSRSPALHQQEGDAQSLRLIYKLIDLEVLGMTAKDLPFLLDAAQATGFCGLNITHPCKQAVIPLLDELSDDAAAIGAVNTVVFKDGRRIGYNTDCLGYEAAFRDGLPDVARKRVVQLGAGGAGAAVANAAGLLGTETLVLFDTDPARSGALAQALCRRFGPGCAVAGSDLPAEMAQADGLIQCTPIGMAHHPGLPLPADLIRPELWVSEVIYVPLETELLALARGRGCRTLDGSGMNIYQAAAAFRYFTGREPDIGRMRVSFGDSATYTHPKRA